MKIEVTTVRKSENVTDEKISIVHENFMNLLAKKFGGVSVFECDGKWYSKDLHEFFNDKCRRYEVITTINKFKEIKSLIDDVAHLALDLNEYCILLRVGMFSRFIYSDGSIERV